MSRKFQVGDRVRVNCLGSKSHGAETVITWIGWGLVEMIDCSSQYVLHCRVDLPSVRLVNGVRVPAGFEPHELIPVYDGNERVSWSECAWQPKSLVQS